MYHLFLVDRFLLHLLLMVLDVIVQVVHRLAGVHVVLGPEVKWLK